MESLPVFDDHYLKMQDAIIDIEGLEKIGWFKKRMEIALKDVSKFVKLFNSKTKEPIP